MNPPLAIQEKTYLSKRSEPSYGDDDYLHLTDLLAALKKFGVSDVIGVLDFGAGGSPYRSLFPNADYKRADFEQMANLDYVIGEESRIREKDETFDLILSTQVAEHVVNPASYFAECYRLLKNGGQLICTTHGTYPDHGCPYDFQRWTADGLTRDIKAAGFTVEKTYKLTTNARALMYLVQRFSGWFDTKAGMSAITFRVMRSVLHRSPKFWQKLADRAFADNKVVSADVPGHDFYTGLLVAARKG